ncbi:hypothetical protein TNCV_971871 [Trichonephila clavipes]|nr:hypothetical protein TNCV_971871 [Trichonephila clavipes]
MSHAGVLTTHVSVGELGAVGKVSSESKRSVLGRDLTIALTREVLKKHVKAAEKCTMLLNSLEGKSWLSKSSDLSPINQTCISLATALDLDTSKRCISGATS